MVLGVGVVIAHRVGVNLERDGWIIHLRMAPFYGRRWAPIDAGWLIAFLFGCALVPIVIAVARRVAFVAMAWASAAVHAAWVLGLAMMHSPTEIGRPMAHRHGYLPVVDQIDGPGEFVRDFLTNAPSYPIHVRGHPPLFPLALWGLDRVGLGGATSAGVVVAVVAASGVAAVILSLRRVLDETWARRAAPFLALAAFAPLVASTADAAFAGVSAWAVYAVVVASTSLHRRSRVVGSAISGVLVGTAMLLTYGAGVVALAVGVIALFYRRVDVAAITASVTIALLGLAGLVGFSYIEGLRYVREEYHAGVANTRPYLPFVLINVVVFAVMVGPAAVAGLAHAVRTRAAILRVASIGLGMALVALLSGMSKGEVERIWLPFAIWTVVAAAAFVRRPHVVAALVAQIATAVAFQFIVKSW